MAGTIRKYQSVACWDGMRQCEEGIVYQEDTSISIEYGDNYWENYLKYEKSPIAEDLNKFRVDITERFCNHVLDIGIGCGTFMKRLNIKSYGYDINPKAISWLEERGLYLNPYEGIPDEVDGITLWDVLEHLPEPDDLLTHLPVGIHVVTSLPIFSYLESLRESKHYKPNEHYWYFTQNGLTTYMSDIGYMVKDCRSDESRIGRHDIKTFVFEKVS